tara:strand:+ start:479 stop:2434 length:1956 start_codon:yes stop_codon:yes gene_type:complete
MYKKFIYLSILPTSYTLYKFYLKKKIIIYNMGSIVTKELDNILLNNKSKKAEQPSYCIYHLWEHQKIMLNKCEELEKENKEIIAITDDPGTGKTNVILSLISNSIGKKTSLFSDEYKNIIPNTVIIVTNNIYKQWIDAIKNYTNIKYKKFIEYSDISSLYFNTKVINGYDLIITTPIYYKVISEICDWSINESDEKKLNFKRIVIDEISDIDFFIQSNIICKHTWLISGTFDINKSGYFKDKKINIVKCEKLLYKSLNELEEPNINYIVSQNKELELTYDLFTTEELQEINGLGFKNTYDNIVIHLHNKILEEKERYNKEYTELNDFLDSIHNKNIDDNYSSDEDKNIDETNYKQLVKQCQIKVECKFLKIIQKKRNKLSKLYNISEKKLDMLSNRLTDSKSCIICFNELSMKEMYLPKCCLNIYCRECIQKTIETKRQCAYCRTEINLNNFYNHEKIINLYDDMKINNSLLELDHKLIINSIGKKYSILEKINFNNNKEDSIINKLKLKHDIIKTDKTKLDILKNLLINSNIDDRSIIVFVDYVHLFDKIQQFLNDNNITNTKLDGGSLRELEKQIYFFKSNKANVLLADSSIHSCGLNLENTTDIILINSHNKDIETQIINRAQRPGRIGTLNITKIYYSNEIIKELNN